MLMNPIRNQFLQLFYLFFNVNYRKKILSQKFVEKGRKNIKESHKWKDQLHWLYCSHQYRSCSWWSCEQAPPWWLIDSLQTEICDGLWEQGQTNKMICAHLQTYILDCLFGAWQCKSFSAHPINMNTCKNIVSSTRKGLYKDKAQNANSDVRLTNGSFVQMNIHQEDTSIHA